MNAHRTLIDAAGELGRAFAAQAAEHDRTGAAPVAQFKRSNGQACCVPTFRPTKADTAPDWPCRARS